MRPCQSGEDENRRDLGPPVLAYRVHGSRCRAHAIGVPRRERVLPAHRTGGDGRRPGKVGLAVEAADPRDLNLDEREQVDHVKQRSCGIRRRSSFHSHIP